MTKNDLKHNEYNTYYEGYIQQAGPLELLEGLKQSAETTVSFLESIPEARLEFSYAEGKWTIKEIIQHLIDTERIFTYRALCIARKDKTLLPGYDQDSYVAHGSCNYRILPDFISEYRSLRQVSILLFQSFSEDMLKEVGSASNSNLSARAVAFIITGHEQHHCKIIKERYL